MRRPPASGKRRASRRERRGTPPLSPRAAPAAARSASARGRVDLEDHLGDGGNQQVARALAAHQVDVVRAGAQHLDELAEGVPVRVDDGEADEVVDVELALRQRGQLLLGDLDQRAAQHVGRVRVLVALEDDAGIAARVDDLEDAPRLAAHEQHGARLEALRVGAERRDLDVPAQPPGAVDAPDGDAALGGRGDGVGRAIAAGGRLGSAGVGTGAGGAAPRARPGRRPGRRRHGRATRC